jgi:trigger factor
LGLLLAEVGRINTVTVSQDDINRAVLNEARAYPGQEHLVLQYYQKNHEALEALRAPVYEEKVVDFILEKAQITEREIAAEDLRREAAEAEGIAESASADEEGKEAAKPKKPRAPRKKASE